MLIPTDFESEGGMLFYQKLFLFISFVPTKETKQRKALPRTCFAKKSLHYATQKELASLKQLFVFNAAFRDFF